MISSKRHFVVLDGLRGVAAVTVAILHLFVLVLEIKAPPHAQLAVDFFFMLSGFVVAYAYEDKLINKMSFSIFSAIRVIRLYPMLFLGVMIGILSRILDGAAGYDAIAIFGAAAFAFLLLPLPRQSATVSAFPLNGPLWSITYELISNLAYAATIRWLSTRVLVIVAVLSSVLLAIILVQQNGVQASARWGLPLIYGFPRVFAPFTIGVLLLRLSGDFDIKSSALPVTAALFLLIILWMPLNESAIYDLVSVLIGFPIILLIAAKSCDYSPLNGLWKILGAISYPLYATNEPFFRICSFIAKKFDVSKENMLLFAFMSFVISLLAAFLILIFYDEPVRRFLSKKLLKRDVAVAKPTLQIPNA